MAFQNCSALFFTLIVCIFLLITPKNAAVLAKNPLVFACDFEKNPFTRNFTFCDSSLDTKTRVDDLINRLTLQEKIIMLGNNQRNFSQLGIPEYYWWSEALHGVASGFGNGGRSTFFTKLIPGATSFPQVILTAATFNKSLFQAIGRVVSTEARAMHNVGQAGLTFWSPNVNIFRDPRWGRGQETPGEDPYLSSTYGSAYVRGLQETDDGDKDRLKVAACCKHYTAYDLESWKGIDRFRFNAEVTKQDLADTFQPPFKSCVVDGNVASVMCSYNLVNGKPSCGDQDLLVGVVRGEWKLNGYISSDCDSLYTMFNQQHWTKTPEETVAAALHAGLDLNCGYWLQDYTESAVQKGLVKESDIDRAISNNLATLMRVGFFDGNPTKQMYGNLGPHNVCTSENRQLAREAAQQGIVLLMNSPGSLPLSPNSISSLAVIGPNANATDTMLGNYRGIPCGYTSPLQGLTSLVPTVYFNGCGNVTCRPDEVDIDGAKKVAATADAVVLIMGVDQSIEAEGLDRTDITLPGLQSFLVSEVANVSKGPVILVIMSGSGMDIQFAKDDPKITSILWAGYPGEAGGAALADIIFGYYSPSGRLPMTWYPQSFVDEVPMTNMSMRPDLATGYPGRTYRFYTGETVYDFSYGLSYTEFNYSFVEAPPKVVSLALEEGHVCHSSKCKSIDVDELHCRDLGFEISVKITNVGEMRGSETVTLFSFPPFVHNAPQKQLLDFEKVMLEPLEEEVVKFEVDGCKDFSVIDEDGNRKIALGTHVLLVGSLGIFVTVGI